MDLTPHHHATPDAAEHLLTCFFDRCGKEFGFLERKHGFTSIRGLSQHRNGRRIFTPFRAPCTVPVPFEAAMLFEKDDTALEASYGGGDYALDLHVYYGRIHRFLLRAVFEAARKSDATLDTARARTITVLEKTLQDAGATVRRNIGLITAPNPKLIERTLTIHDKRLEEGVRTQYRRDMDDAATEAAKAFTGRDYPRVVTLLAPYEEYLNAASLKKLNRARQHLLDI